MKFFLFKFFLKLARKFAPSEEVSDFLNQRLGCLLRQKDMDNYIRPRTETYEHLTHKVQRDVFTKLMPPRTVDSSSRRLYSDYDERGGFTKENNPKRIS